MSAIDAPPGRLDIGRVISETFAVIGRNIATFAVLGVVLSGIPTGIVTFFQYGTMKGQMAAVQSGTFNFGAGYFEAVGLGGLVALITTSILQGALIYATVQDLNGQRASVGDSLATGLRNFLPLIGVSILFALAVGFGFVFLFVPGIIIACMWCVAVPSLIADRTGVFGAFTRAGQLTKGNRWAIFGLGVVIVIVLIVVGAVFGAITGVSAIGAGGADAIARALSPISLVLQVVQSTISGVIGATFAAVLYVELRRARDGAGPQWLADIFN